MTSTQNECQHALPSVEVVIEIPRGSFLKRGSSGHIDFISPIPCPYNYGSIHQYIGGEGDYLDAVVLGPRLAAGTRVQVNAYGSVGLSERYMSDDKLICSVMPITDSDRRNILLFFNIYAACKGFLNVLRGQKGRSSCDGWDDAAAAIARAVPVGDTDTLQQPKIGF
ncbi:MAG: inorganic diphosphatase [Proteobacteria bacterium]|nr:inorganic diphosphatase [Pseudomonadota bacterium]